MFGGEKYLERGIIPRSLNFVYQKINENIRNNLPFSFKCQVSFCEIYKESIYDLLDSNISSGQSEETLPTVQIFEGEDGLTLRNLSVFDAKCEEDALQLFFLGNANRITLSTSMNETSSRSHAIFTLTLDSEVIKNEKTIYTSGKVHFVDLAGSERMYKVY